MPRREMKPTASWRASLLRVSASTVRSLFVRPMLYLLREPLSEVAHRAGEHVQKLGSSSAFKCERAPQATDEEENTRIQGSADGN